MRHNSAAGTNSSRRFLLRKEDQDDTLQTFFSTSGRTCAPPSRPHPPSSARVSSSSRFTAAPSSRLWTPASGTSRLSSAVPRSELHSAVSHTVPSPSSRRSGRTPLRMDSSSPSRIHGRLDETPSSALSKRHALWHPDQPAPSGTTSWLQSVTESGMAARRSSRGPKVPEPFALPNVLPAKETPLPPGDVIVYRQDESLSVSNRKSYPLAHTSPSDPVVDRPTLQTKRQEVSTALDRLEALTQEKLAVARKHRSKAMGDPDYDACDEGEKSLLNIPKPIKEDEWTMGKPSQDFESNFGDIMGMFLSERKYSVEDLEMATARRMSTLAPKDDVVGGGLAQLSPQEKGKLFRSFQDKHAGRKKSATNSRGW